MVILKLGNITVNHAKKLRTLLQSNKTILTPGIYDGFTGLMVENSGFECAYVSGASISYSQLGRSDVGLTTLTEVSNTISRIRERINIPFVVDADTGFGNALNVQRTVKVLENAGASGIQLEDQTMPKRCGHLDGKKLISKNEMVGKIKAAKDTLRNKDTLIIGRTDAIAVNGFDEAMIRADAYLEAGVDILFIEAPESLEQMKIIGSNFSSRVSLLANMVEGGRTPQSSASELTAMGFNFIIFPGAMIRTFAFAAKIYLENLKKEGSTHKVRDKMFNFDELNDLLGTQDLLDNVKKYDL